MSSRMFQGVVIQMKDATNRAVGVGTPKATSSQAVSSAWLVPSSAATSMLWLTP